MKNTSQPGTSLEHKKPVQHSVSDGIDRSQERKVSGNVTGPGETSVAHAEQLPEHSENHEYYGANGADNATGDSGLTDTRH